MIWVGTGDNGVDRFHPDQGRRSTILRRTSRTGRASSITVISLLVDRERDSVGRHPRRAFPVRSEGWDLHPFHAMSPSNPRSIAGNRVQCSWKTGRAESGLAYMSGLDFLYRLDRSPAISPQSGRSHQSGATDNRIYSLCEDRAGTLWVGTYGRGSTGSTGRQANSPGYQAHDSLSPGVSAHTASGRSVEDRCGDSLGRARWGGD